MPVPFLLLNDNMLQIVLPFEICKIENNTRKYKVKIFKHKNLSTLFLLTNV